MADSSFYLFAGLPLKRVAATGIAHPGTNGEICFCVFALYREVEGSTGGYGCPVLFCGFGVKNLSGPGAELLPQAYLWC
jgi:hypothetical protein